MSLSISLNYSPFSKHYNACLIETCHQKRKLIKKSVVLYRGSLNTQILLAPSSSSSSSSSCRAASTDILNPLSPLLAVVHRLWQVLRATSHSCCMYVRAGRPALSRPYVGVHRSTSLMSSSLLLQQCPACLVPLTWIVFVMGGRWPYSWCFVGCYCQDLFNIVRKILV